MLVTKCSYPPFAGRVIIHPEIIVKDIERSELHGLGEGYRIWAGTPQAIPRREGGVL